MLRDKVIGIDVDDTAIDLMTTWLDFYNKIYGDNLKRKQIKSWNMAQYTDNGHGDKIYEILKLPDLLDYCEPIPHALEVVNRFREYNEVIFVTAGNHPAKLQRLCELGFVHTKDEYFVAHNKSKIKMDVLIDDGAHNHKNFDGLSVLYTQEWNKNIFTGYNMVRVGARNWRVGWYDIEALFFGGNSITNKTVEFIQKIRRVKMEV